MARWAQIWAPKLGPKSGPQIWAPNSSPIGTLSWKEGQGPFFGALPGVRKWSQLCKQVGVWVQKRAAKRKLANLPQTANISPSRSLGKRAAEKIKATTFRCGLNPHELFTTLWSNRLQLLSWRHETCRKHCQHISSRSLGKRAAEKIKATTFRCGLNPHELFTTLWSNREGPNRWSQIWGVFAPRKKFQVEPPPPYFNVAIVTSNV